VSIAFIGLGANLGEREAAIREALRRLESTPEIRVERVSSLRETEPVGGPAGQPRYLNGAARLSTTLTPRALLQRLLAVEAELGRVRAERYGPRTIDLDLLLYDEERIREPDLVVPHPRMRERPFVMEPLAEIGYHPPPMRIYDSIDAIRNAVRDARRAGKSVGFVPTMGALHEGHLSLARRAKSECDVAFASIFVNPTQFGPNEDFARYPRDLDGDRLLLERTGIDGIFTTSPEAMYPPGFRTYVVQDGLTTTLEGAIRPGHFRGVLTVVMKLFQIVRPDRAYFGQKDLQQTIVLRRMVEDLNVPVEMVICPTVREVDGLAMSSRNRYLSPGERAAGLSLSRGLFAAQSAFQAGERRGSALRAHVVAAFASAPSAVLDYAEVVSTSDLAPIENVSVGDAAVVAARFGSTRLIDNVIFRADLT